MPQTLKDIELENIKIDPSILTIEESYEIVRSRKEGLTDVEAEERLEQYGKNELPEKKEDSKLKIFVSNFHSPLIYALFVAAGLALILGKNVDAVVIFAVIMINAVIGYVQEIKAKKDIDALKKLSSFSIKVLRGGRVTQLDTSEIVPGDVVILGEGIKIPADGRLVEVNSLLVNESSLTGESVLVSKTDEKIAEGNHITAPNMVYQGTVVAEGAGKFLVLSTAGDTKFGKIALYAQESTSETPIQKKIKKLSKQIGLAVLGVCFVVFLTGVLGGRPVMEMVQLSISLAVSAIPEGLPIAVTIILVLGAKRMAKRKAIVRNMMAVETLGTTTVIATDKTGTLTHNKLKVTDIYTDSPYRFEQNETNGSYYKGNKKYSDDYIRRLLICGAVCNDADFDRENDEFIGESTDVAILENATSCGIKKRLYPRLDEAPFSSEKRYMAVLAKEDSSKYVFMKGAAEEVLARCSYYLTNKKKLSPEDKKRILNQVRAMSEKGLRVVALAGKRYQKDFSKSLSGDFVLLGLLGMKDTYRPGVKEAIAKCKEAGIRIVMLTGDHLDTATAIAKKLAIISSNEEATLAHTYFMGHGKQKKKINQIAVFARILPELKYKVISSLKKQGEVVAMTGDGVNDVPALRKADIGLAMGISGTDAAKEAADIVLADDNFATIVSAVEEGRTIFANLRKTILYLISTSAGEVLAVFGSLVLGLPLPMTPLQILWINLITDTSATIPLGVEPKEDEHLKVPPRNPKEGLVSPLIIRRSLLVGIYMAVGALLIFKANLASGLDYARTVTFLFLTISQWVNAFNCRSEKKSVFRVNLFTNNALLIGITLGIILQVGVMYLPLLTKVFNFVPVGLGEWGFSVLAALGLVVLIEVDKLISNAVRAKAEKNEATAKEKS